MNNFKADDIVQTSVDKIVYGENWKRGTWCRVLEVTESAVMVIPVFEDEDYIEYYKFNELDLIEEEII